MSLPHRQIFEAAQLGLPLELQQRVDAGLLAQHDADQWCAWFAGVVDAIYDASPELNLQRRRLTCRQALEGLRSRLVTCVENGLEIDEAQWRLDWLTGVINAIFDAPAPQLPPISEG